MNAEALAKRTADIAELKRITGREHISNCKWFKVTSYTRDDGGCGCPGGEHCLGCIHSSYWPKCTCEHRCENLGVEIDKRECIDECVSDAAGRLILHQDGGWDSAANYCPFCGFKGIPWPTKKEAEIEALKKRLAELEGP